MRVVWCSYTDEGRNGMAAALTPGKDSARVLDAGEEFAPGVALAWGRKPGEPEGGTG